MLACGHKPGVGTNTAPAPKISSPHDGDEVRAGALVTLEGSATDAEDGTLPGASLSWSSNLMGDLGKGAHVSVSLNAGTHWILLTAIDSAGLAATAQITLHAKVAPNEAPHPVIDSPADGTTFDEGHAITLTGHADDAEDGSLPGSSLAWTSSLDGALGTGATVSIPSPSQGTHAILLTATDLTGATAYASISITVVPAGTNHAPAASISAPADGASFVEGAVVGLTGSASDAEDGTLSGASLAWSSSLDGALGTGTSLPVSTLRRGAHVITLTATDSKGAHGEAHVGISIVQAGNHPPVASISAPANGTAVFAGTSVTFTGTATDVEDGTLSGASLSWTSSRDGALGAGASITTSGLTVGAHAIRLTATDSRGDSDAAEIGVTVLAPNQPPAVSITSPAGGAQVDAGQTVQLRGSASDPEDGALTGASLSWTSSVDGLLGHGVSLDTASLQPGAHTLTLTAIDSGGRTGSASVGITVKPAPVNLAPVARLQLPLQALIGESVTADGSGSTDSDGSIVNYAFSFGDSTPDASGTARSVAHVWTAEGTYTVGLTVTDDQGATGTASAQIHVAAVTRVPGVIDDGPDTLGAACSLGIAPNGSVVIAYRNMTHPGLRVATVTTGGAVTLERADGMGYEIGGAVDVELSLALAADGTPHLAYALETGALWYATRSAGGWLHERIDGTVARFDDPSSYVAIALDPSRGQRPTVAYSTPAPQTVIATRSGGVWTDTVVGSSSTYLGGLAVSPAGSAVFNVYQGGYRIGSWDGAAAEMTVSSALSGVSSFYHEPVTLGLDPSGSAVAAYATSVARVGATATLSPYEETSTASASVFVDSAGAAWLAYSHGGQLEVATALDGTYWRRTGLGATDAGHPSIAVDGAGNARVCFFRSGKLMLY